MALAATPLGSSSNASFKQFISHCFVRLWNFNRIQWINNYHSYSLCFGELLPSISYSWAGARKHPLLLGLYPPKSKVFFFLQPFHTSMIHSKQQQHRCMATVEQQTSCSFHSCIMSLVIDHQKHKAFSYSIKNFFSRVFRVLIKRSQKGSKYFLCFVKQYVTAV